jgi:Flp pilus assembly protein TadB
MLAVLAALFLVFVAFHYWLLISAFYLVMDEAKQRKEKENERVEGRNQSQGKKTIPVVLLSMHRLRSDDALAPPSALVAAEKTDFTKSC